MKKKKTLKKNLEMDEVYIVSKMPIFVPWWKKLWGAKKYDIHKVKMSRENAEKFMNQIAESGASHYISYYMEEL